MQRWRAPIIFGAASATISVWILCGKRAISSLKFAPFIAHHAPSVFNKCSVFKTKSARLEKARQRIISKSPDIFSTRLFKTSTFFNCKNRLASFKKAVFFWIESIKKMQACGFKIANTIPGKPAPEPTSKILGALQLAKNGTMAAQSTMCNKMSFKFFAAVSWYTLFHFKMPFAYCIKRAICESSAQFCRAFFKKKIRFTVDFWKIAVFHGELVIFLKIFGHFFKLSLIFLSKSKE